MSDPQNQGGGADGDFDLTQFYQVFFEEAADNLSTMEQLLLNLSVDAPEDEDLNAIFRCAHSIKGGAATFGFADVTELTHVMESLLDRLRRHELGLTAAMVDTLLVAGDQLVGMLAVHQNGEGEVADTVELVARIKAFIAGEAAAPGQAVPGSAAASAADDGLRHVQLRLGPLANPALADMVCELFSDIPDLGRIEPAPDDVDGEPIRLFVVHTASSDDDLIDLFSMHVDRAEIELSPLGDASPVLGAVADAAPPPAATPVSFAAGEEAEAWPAEALADVPPRSEPVAPLATAAPEPAAGTRPALHAVEGASESAPAQAAKPAAAKADANGQTAMSGATIRVSVEKVDQLINLMGELVITQAMLAQAGRSLDKPHHSLMAGLADLERSTRHMQEAVMSIRMIPMAFVFNRFPRMLRDLAGRLGKKVEIETFGESTELDKGLIEKITDPLTHLLRNSVDHGIEMPDERIRAGKPAVGRLSLSAAHQGGSIVIEVRDDGKGLDRERILRKARESGLPVHDGMTDSEVWQLIFEPGFSTAEQVTEVSGRGVGMDVVKRNIQSLGGVVTIESWAGLGTRISVRLPLTLAIMDGMSVGVGGDTFILPMSTVVESFQSRADHVRTIQGRGRVVEVRGEYLPVVTLDEVFRVGHQGRPGERALMVVIRIADRRIALQVDELQGQLQVVVKNLETNYKRVPGVSGATILGDGRVALILDVDSIMDLVTNFAKQAA